MAGDHLTQRQLNSGYTVMGQHPLTDTSTGLYAKSAATNWIEQQSRSIIALPRCGKVGFDAIDYYNNKTLECQLYNTAQSPVTNGITIEAVVTTSVTGYNFFGGIWGRNALRVHGWYAYSIGIELWPVNDSINDTAGRAIVSTIDVGGNRVASRTVHSRPVISDGLPHHILATHAPTGTSNVLKLWVDGVNTETVTTTAPMADIAANSLFVGVNDYFTGWVGSISHCCLTNGVLPDAEIKARANLVNAKSGSKLTDIGTMVWHASSSTWRPIDYNGGRSGSNWYPAKGMVTIEGGDYTEEINVAGTVYRVHYFTTVGTYNIKVTKSKSVEYLIVGGGGSGGAGSTPAHGDKRGGGGGGGQVIAASATLSAGTYSITVGSGGRQFLYDGETGANSSFNGSTAYGGAGGKTISAPPTNNGPGGGSGYSSTGGASAQSYAGAGTASVNTSGGGGGGAGGVGSMGTTNYGGNGGIGYTSSITGTSTVYGAGGGGAGATGGGAATSDRAGGGSSTVVPGWGKNSRGGGGGGAYTSDQAGGYGGSGIVIIRYAI